MRPNLSATLAFVSAKLADLRFAGLDQNPHGIRDLLGSCVLEAERMEKAEQASTVPSDESLAASLAMLSRLIGTDHPVGRQQMRDIVDRAKRDTVELIRTGRELAALWESRPVREKRIEEVTAQMRAAIAKAEGRSNG